MYSKQEEKEKAIYSGYAKSILKRRMQVWAHVTSTPPSRLEKPDRGSGKKEMTQSSHGDKIGLSEGLVFDHSTRDKIR